MINLSIYELKLVAKNRVIMMDRTGGEDASKYFREI